MGFITKGHACGLAVRSYRHDDGVYPIEAEDRFFAWLRSLEGPICIYSPADDTAAWLRDQANNRHLSMPDDIGIIGTGDHIVCTHRQPTLTSVAYPWYQMGEAAAMAILHRQRGNSEPPLARISPFRVVTRESTTVAPVDDPLVRRALTWLSRHLSCTNPAERAAAELSVDPSTLTRHFRKALNSTPKQEQLRLRLAKAEGLLASDEVRMDEIARRAGFSSNVALTVAFKRSRGVAPSFWRKDL
jgi:AraC-like DNA-binding protein